MQMKSKRAGMADKISQNCNRQEVFHYIIIKGSIHQENITIVNIYIRNIRAPKYINRSQGRNSNAIILGDLNILFSTMDRPKSINKELKVKQLFASNMKN